MYTSKESVDKFVHLLITQGEINVNGQTYPFHNMRAHLEGVNRQICPFTDDPRRNECERTDLSVSPETK